jgi:hypothetical protein
MQDPTRDDMLTSINVAFDSEARGDGTMLNFDVEQAIYWFANDWHGGQWSNLYSALSTSEYHPGALECGCEPESTAADMYQHLVETFIEHDCSAASFGNL